MESTLDVREKQDLIEALERADLIVHKKYLAQLQNYDIVPVSEELKNREINDIARFYKLEQFAYDKTENTRDKLVSVFQAVASVDASVILLINGMKNGIEYYIGVRSLNKNPAKAHEVLYKSLSANFPGISFKNYTGNIENMDHSAFPVSKSEIESIYKNIFGIKDSNVNKSITSITGIAGLRAEKETSEQRFIQGIEKVIDAMQGEVYLLLLIAEPVSNLEVQKVQQSYEHLYSAIKPFETTDLTYGENESESISKTLSQGTTNTINHSLTNTITKTESETTTKNKGVVIGAAIGTTAGVILGSVVPGPGNVAGGVIGSAVGGAVGGAIGTIVSPAKSHTEGLSNSTATTRGESQSYSDTKSDTNMKGSGSTKTLQIKFENKAVKKIIEKIDLQLKRIETAQSLGMWNCAAYCIADKSVVSEMAAAAYYSVIRGENSHLETGSITTWKGNNLLNINDYLKKMLHPIINIEGTEIPAASFITTKELVLHAGFPEKSVAGLPVKTMAAFGRDVIYQSQKKYIGLKLGKIYHMGKPEAREMYLDKDSLASHTFITGSTGSGKSNTIYKILNEAKKNGCKFLVIEPAKGEYKHIFGNRSDVSVYGTNQFKSPLLKINPFKFPKDIHVLEHLDRLVEIFNVCWPMYAAMPAVLKEAVEKSYEDAGWSLIESFNPYGENLYPSFEDVARNVRIIINSSEYDTESKGAYKGALLTRLKSLTNGINGMIFTNEDISDKDLFDKNVIVDLSRVGSTETKSLIMGILVMKLQEYRMTSGKLNASLSHITVLEEAHNLLKRTSTEQSTETANLIGKSVEMLANSIAEMRTFGEGFIIADQSPGLLDMSVIRNTNTKIIMRTPDFSDRELVGKAAGLNDDQIIEIGKLPLGVASVYQNDWIEPVLCKVDHYSTTAEKYKYEKADKQEKLDSLNDRLSIARFLCQTDDITQAEKIRLIEIIDKLNLSASTSVMIQKFIKAPPSMPRFTKIAPVISALFWEIRTAFIESFNRTSDTEQWSLDVNTAIQNHLHLDVENQLSKDIRQCIITDYLHNELGKTELLEKWSNEGGVK